ncbi:MAG: SDR family oxidoreductase [Myxococcota bacterium]|nr:SDR family oxidoreductase [Myxococcota bacterium]
MSERLKGRAAIVTGGGRGIGQGVVRAFAAEGAKLLIAQRNAELGEAEAAHLRETYGVEAHFCQTDVTQRDQVERMIDVAVERLGGLDILVNNAGASRAIRLENHTDEEMQAGFDVNYWAVFWAMKAAFPLMRAQGYGRIVNMGTLNGVNAHMFTVAYNASKEAMRALSRTAAVEWGEHGITVNVICPAASSDQANAYLEANPEMHAAILRDIPVGRMGDSEQDIGPVAVFLASEDSGYVTGNTLFASGGSHVSGVSWRPTLEDGES